jgi:hypothetical protein
MMDVLNLVVENNERNAIDGTVVYTPEKCVNITVLRSAMPYFQLVQRLYTYIYIYFIYMYIYICMYDSIMSTTTLRNCYHFSSSSINNNSRRCWPLELLQQRRCQDHRLHFPAVVVGVRPIPHGPSGGTNNSSRWSSSKELLRPQQQQQQQRFQTTTTTTTEDDEDAIRALIHRSSFQLSKQGLISRENEMRMMMTHPTTNNNADNTLSYFHIDMPLSFAETLHQLAVTIREKLEATFPKRLHRTNITEEQYNDPTTKILPLYLQPRSMTTLPYVTLWHGSTAVRQLPDDQVQNWYHRVVTRLEQSGCIHADAVLSTENIAHFDDYYFTMDSVYTYPPKQHNYIVVQLQASLGLYRLYEDFQIAANQIPGLRHMVHRSVSARKSVWEPQIIIANVVNGMEGCKKEERRLRNLLYNLPLRPPPPNNDHDNNNNNNSGPPPPPILDRTTSFAPTGISLRGYRPTLPQDQPTLYDDWDFTFQHLVEAGRRRPELPQWSPHDWYLSK